MIPLESGRGVFHWGVFNYLAAKVAQSGIILLIGKKYVASLVYHISNVVKRNLFRSNELKYTLRRKYSPATLPIFAPVNPGNLCGW